MMKINKKLTAAWLVNLSVATLAIGLFQDVSPIPLIGAIPKPIMLMIGTAEFLLANYLQNKAEEEDKK